jgi:hypothetical protein
MNYKDVVVEENWGNSYMVKVKGVEEPLLLCVGADTPDGTICLHEVGWDGKEYFEKDIVEILSECEYEEEDDYEDEDNIDWKMLENYMVQPNVFEYGSKEDLNQIVSWLDQPNISHDSFYNGTYEQYVENLDKEYGIVFYWCEYDDYSLGDGLRHFIKIISGAKIV